MGINHVYRTGDARIKGMDRAEDLQRFLRVSNRSPDESVLYGALLSLCIRGSKIPCGRNNLLVVLDLALLDVDPVAQGATRNIVQAHALAVSALVEFV